MFFVFCLFFLYISIFGFLSFFLIRICIGVGGEWPAYITGAVCMYRRSGDIEGGGGGGADGKTTGPRGGPEIECRCYKDGGTDQVTRYMYIYIV